MEEDAFSSLILPLPLDLQLSMLAKVSAIFCAVNGSDAFGGCLLALES